MQRISELVRTVNKLNTDTSVDDLYANFPVKVYTGSGQLRDIKAITLRADKDGSPVIAIIPEAEDG